MRGDFHLAVQRVSVAFSQKMAGAAHIALHEDWASGIKDFDENPVPVGNQQVTVGPRPLPHRG
jgi:hypothetical protein